MTILECGLDEAGRGPLAGPVTAGCVILPEDFPFEILNDSKKLSEIVFSLIKCMYILWPLCQDGQRLERLSRSFHGKQSMSLIFSGFCFHS